MRKNGDSHSGRMFSDRKWIIPFFSSLVVSMCLVPTTVIGIHSSAGGEEQSPFDLISFNRSEDSSGYFVELDLKTPSNAGGGVKMEAPRFAYLISGTKGDSHRMMRTLEAGPRERLELANAVKADPIFREVDNTRVMS